MKKIILPVLFALISNALFSQITLKKGIINSYVSGLSELDTVIVLSAYKNKGKIKYYVYNKELGYNNRLFVPERKIELLPDSLGYWENVWFENSYSYYLNKKMYTLKPKDEEQILSYLGELETNQKFYDEPFVEDYLTQVIHRIYTQKASIAGRKLIVTPKLINDPTIKTQPLANGFLLIGVDFLAKLKSEEELYSEISKCIAHIVLMHGVYNINDYDPYETNPLGIKLTSSQKKEAEKIARDYIKTKKDTNLKFSQFISNVEFYSKLSNVMNYVAWQEYYSNHLDKSIELLDKLVKNDLASEETFFLKAKILKQLHNNYASNLEALELLNKAEKMRVHGYMDIYKEQGLILLRLGRKSEAAEAFKKYKMALSQQTEPDQLKIKWCNTMLHRCTEKSGQTAKLN